MSQCKLVVHGSDLVTLAESLDEVCDRTVEMRRRLKHLDRSACGSQDLDHALDEFQDHWDWGVDRLSRRLDTATGQLRAAARTFSEIDVELRRSLCG